MAVIYSDDFNRADQNPISTPWSAAFASTAGKIASNEYRASALTAANYLVRYGSFPISDMKATVKINAFTTTVNCQLRCYVRESPTAVTHYGMYLGSEYAIGKELGGSFTELAITSGNNPTAGNTFGISAVGTTLKGYEDGAEIHSLTDSSLTSGTWAFGIAAFNAPGSETEAVLDDVVLEAFEPFFVAAGTEGSAANGNVSPGLPTGIQESDILVCACHSSDQVAHSMSADWTQVAQGNGGSTTSRLSVWYHRYDGVNNPSTTITHTGGQSPIAGIAAFRNVYTIGDPCTAGTIAAGTDASIEHNGITPVGDANALLLVINGSADDNDRTLLSDYINVFEDTGVGTNNAFITTAGNPDGSVSMFFKSVPITDTGTVTVTQQASDAWASVLVALRQAVAAAAAGANIVPLLYHRRRMG